LNVFARQNSITLNCPDRKPGQIVIIALIHARSRAPAWSALLAARRTGIPFVTTYHGAYGEKGKLKNWYNSVMARGDMVIANSHYIAKLIRSRYGVGEGEILVGNVAFLRHYKGHEFIARTAATMPENYRFMLVGGGDRVGLSLVEEAIERAGVGDRFILTGHREDPERFFSAFDIIFFSSFETEGISQSFIQGLLYGIPLLTTRIPSILEPLEFVRKYRTVDYGDVDGAGRGLLELAENLARDEQEVAAQRAAVSAKYGIATMVATIVGTYADHGVSVAR